MQRQDREGLTVIIAGVIIETLPGRAACVSARLVNIQGLTLHGGDGNSRIAAVWNSGTAQSLEEEVGSLVELDEDVVGVYPTFVAEDEL